LGELSSLQLKQRHVLCGSVVFRKADLEVGEQIIVSLSMRRNTDLSGQKFLGILGKTLRENT
jgi:hypothetical protein